MTKHYSQEDKSHWVKSLKPKQSKQAHTPTPYDLSIHPETKAIRLINKESRHRIGRIKTLQDASFITRACNRDHVFEELLEACKLALTHYQWCSKANPLFKDSGTTQKLKQVIAKAEGK